LVNASHPLDFKEALPLLAHGGADFSHFDVGAYTSFSVAENRGDAVKAAKPVVAFIVAGSLDSVFERHGIDMKDVGAVRSGFKKGFADAVSAVTDEMIDAFSICGTPAECMERIEELVDAGVTQIIPGSPLGPDRVKAIKLIGKDIISRWRKE
ncbi:MAG: LLM class flavin-dependent oxidoreductase, partial [Candidatus Methanoperedens sp.]